MTTIFEAMGQNSVEYNILKSKSEQTENYL